MNIEDKELIQSTIDRLLYCEEYKIKLLELNKQFNPNEIRKLEFNPGKFNYKEDNNI